MNASVCASALDASVRTTSDAAAAVVELKRRIARVRALCEEARADSVSPSEILAILDGER